MSHGGRCDQSLLHGLRPPKLAVLCLPVRLQQEGQDVQVTMLSCMDQGTLTVVVTVTQLWTRTMLSDIIDYSCLQIQNTHTINYFDFNSVTSTTPYI